VSKNRMIGRVFIHLLFASVFFVSSESVAASGAEASLSVNISKTRNREKEQNTEQKGNASVTTAVEKETETCTLEIEIENPAEQAGVYDVQWCVIAKRTSGKDDEKLVISDSGKIEVTRGSKMSGTETINPKPFVFAITSTDRTFNSSVGVGNNSNSTQTRAGDTYAGYIVLVKADGKILAQESNDDRFLKEEWVAQCERVAQPKATASKGKQKKKK